MKTVYETMAQTTNENELPPGIRSSFVCALQADDPQALLIHLEECRQIKRSVLLTHEGAKAPVGFFGYPWSDRDDEETELSQVKKIDNELCCLLNQFLEASFHTLAFCLSARCGSLRIVALLLSDKYRNDINPTFNSNRAIRMASLKGHVEIVKLLMSDTRVDPSDVENEAVQVAIQFKRVDTMTLLLEDKRVDHSVALKGALAIAHVEILRILLADERIAITNEMLSIVDIPSSVRVDALFAAAHPRIWPKIIGNDVDCVSREKGHLRNKLDGLELKSSWMLLLCVKHICTSTVAARVSDVLREVCSEWTCYKSREVEPVVNNDYSDDDESEYGSDVWL